VVHGCNKKGQVLALFMALPLAGFDSAAQASYTGPALG